MSEEMSVTSSPLEEMSQSDGTATEERRTCESETVAAEFTGLVRKHHRQVLNFLFRYVGNRQDAEDLTQETFLKAYRNYHRYDPKYAFTTWLFTIARRTAYNHFRSLRPTEPITFEVVDASDSPDEASERAERKSGIWERARRLRSEYQEVLRLKYLEDLSIQEIASILRKSQTNVKIILFRARNQLRKLSEGEE